MPLSDSLLTSMGNFGNTMGMNVTPYPSAGSSQDPSQDPALRDNLVNMARQAFAEEVRRADQKYELDKQKAKRDYEADMMNARTAADVAKATRRYQDAQAENARERLAFDREKEAGRLQFDKDVQAQNFGLAQAKQGYDLLNLGAQYHNKPLDYFNESEWSRGVAGRPETSTFLSALQNNTRLPDFTGRGAPAEVASLGSLTAKLSGGSPDNSGNYLAQVGNIAAKGPHQIGAGGLEQLTPTEMALFTGGLSKLGYDPDTFLAGYNKSRIGQSAGGGGYQAA